MNQIEAPHFFGHRQRLKSKFLRFGAEGWEDYELLEFILSYAIARKDTKPLAKALMEKFNSLSGVLNGSVDDLKTVEGLGEHSALLLRLFKEVVVRYLRKEIQEKDLLANPQAVLDYLLSRLKNEPDEEVWVLFLNNQNRLITSEQIQKGTVNKSAIFPRQVAEKLLKYKAVSIILAHNHPSGNLQPSSSDIDITKSMMLALQTIDGKLLDHIIISREGYFSFKEQGILL